MRKVLYILISDNLNPIYGCVQGGHAVAQYMLDNPNRSWNNDYLIYLSADIDKWKTKLDLLNINYSSFYESDLNNQLTAIAVENNSKLFKKLKLIE